MKVSTSNQACMVTVTAKASFVLKYTHSMPKHATTFKMCPVLSSAYAGTFCR